MEIFVNFKVKNKCRFGCQENAEEDAPTPWPTIHHSHDDKRFAFDFQTTGYARIGGENIYLFIKK